MAKRALANSIENIPHLASIYDAVKDELSSLGIEKIGIYLVDNAIADVLPHLAEQFNVLGIKGYSLTTTEQEKRDLIKRAVELQKYKGTVWAIKEALRSVGFAGASIVEGSQVLMDGYFSMDGEISMGEGHWATFRVILDLGDYKGISAESTALARKLIDEYKNARSQLIDLTFQSTLTEEVSISEEFTLAEIFTDMDSYTSGTFMDGIYTMNGLFQMNKGRDELELAIYQNNELISTEIL